LAVAACRLISALSNLSLSAVLLHSMPDAWHKCGLYPIDEPAKWISATAPYLRRLVAVLKYAAPLVGYMSAQVRIQLRR